MGVGVGSEGVVEGEHEVWFRDDERDGGEARWEGLSSMWKWRGEV